MRQDFRASLPPIDAPALDHEGPRDDQRPFVSWRRPTQPVSNDDAPEDDVADAWSGFESEAELAEGKAARARRWLWQQPASVGGIWTISAAVLLLSVLAGVGVWWLKGPPTIPTGTVSFTSEPTGAPVVINGVDSGLTPLSLALPLGQHQISVGPAPTARTQTIEIIEGRDAAVHVELAASAPVSATHGTLVISSDPPGASLSIDGRRRGVTPLRVEGLTAGPHTVVVSGDQGSVTRKVTVEAGVTSSLIVALAGQGQFASGALAVTTRVPLQVFENGTLLGSSETPRLLLAAGNHTLDLVNTALDFRVQRRVAIRPGQTTAVTIDAPQGSISINATPWAEVWVDGRSVGETPIGNLSLPIGTHELIFRHPELGESRRTVMVGANGRVRVGVDLRQ